MVTDIAAYSSRRSVETSPDSPVSDERLARLREALVQAVARVCPPWLANDREDIVQLALTKLMENALRDRTELEYSKAYLRKVAYSHVVDEIRRRRRRRESSLEVVDESIPTLVSHRPDPEASSAGSELGKAIRECLTNLVAPRRKAVSLWLLGYSHAEIGRRLGWNRKRAENLVTRGRQNLRDGLARKGFSI